MNLLNNYFGFFKKTNSVLIFDTELDLYTNFNRMCSLPVFKPRSEATKALAEVIKASSHIRISDDYAQITKDQNTLFKFIATLQLIKNAIDEWDHWHKAHNKQSERYDLIQTYKFHIETLQNNIIHYDNQQFLKNRNPSDRVWKNPIFILKDFKRCQMQLIPAQLNSFNHLKSLNELQTSQKNNKRFSYFAILIPIINFLDIDLNAIFDSISVGAEIYNLF